MPIERDRTWAIILAGGEGTRLASLTCALHGEPTPKQFASIDGCHSLLQATILRTETIVPLERMVVIVGPTHARWATPQLAAFPEAAVLVQPASAGTASAILFGLAAIQTFDPDADVLVFPSDHHVSEPGVLVAAARTASAAGRTLDRVVLLGVAPELPDPDYGWIVAGAPLAEGVRALDRFVEKPEPADARALYRSGALWNTFILSAPATALGRVAGAHLPVHTARFEALASRRIEVADAFRDLPAADFSRDVLQRARDLTVVAMRGSGWSDLGTPSRVLATLRGTAAERRVRAGLSAAMHA